MNKFEKFEQTEKTSFDYEQAATLARQKLELENSPDKQKKSQLKNKIKELYGSENVANPEKTPAQRRIFNLELEKQKLILANESNEFKLPVLAREIEHEQDNNFIAKTENNKSVKVTFGDLVSDLNWGVYYDLAGAPVELKKKYLAAYHQNQIANLFDQQLIIQRTELEKDQLDQFYLETYEKVKADLERGGGESAGLLFEKMIHNLLNKIAIDLEQWGIRIEKATVVEDVEEKIDFIIHLPKKKRGVGFEEIEGDETLGIQFTLKSAKSEDFRKKQRQVARSLKNLKEVDDLVLISVPVSHDEIFSKYKIWQHQDKMAGGPENMFKPQEIVNFVKEILQNTELAQNEEFLNEVKKYFEGKK